MTGRLERISPWIGGDVWDENLLMVGKLITIRPFANQICSAQLSIDFAFHGRNLRSVGTANRVIYYFPIQVTALKTRFAVLWTTHYIVECNDFHSKVTLAQRLKLTDGYHNPLSCSL